MGFSDSEGQVLFGLVFSFLLFEKLRVVPFIGAYLLGLSELAEFRGMK
jgi:hypothetical protein